MILPRHYFITMLRNTIHEIIQVKNLIRESKEVQLMDILISIKLTLVEYVVLNMIHTEKHVKNLDYLKMINTGMMHYQKQMTQNDQVK